MDHSLISAMAQF